MTPADLPAASQPSVSGLEQVVEFSQAVKLAIISVSYPQAEIEEVETE